MDRLGKWSSWADVLRAVGSGVERLSSQTVIITGCNTGIGKETAKAIVGLNANVVFACRSIEKADAAAADILKDYPEGRITSLQLELSSTSSVASFCEHYANIADEREWPPLSVLVLNAGIVAMEYRTTESGVESTFATNHLGGFLLTKLLLPRLRAAHDALGTPSRVVVVASGSHFGPLLSKDVADSASLTAKVVRPNKDDFRFMKAYGSSKLANVQFAQSLHRAEAPAVVACALHPGSMIATDIARESGVLNFAVKYLLAPFTKSLQQGAATSVMCAVCPPGRLQGLYFADCQEKTASALARDHTAQNALWEVSEGLTKL